MLDDVYSKNLLRRWFTVSGDFLIGYFRWEFAQDVNVLSEG